MPITNPDRIYQFRRWVDQQDNRTALLAIAYATLDYNDLICTIRDFEHKTGEYQHRRDVCIAVLPYVDKTAFDD